MQSVGFMGVVGLFTIAKAILEVVFYVSIISVSFKAVQALNIYINKNS